MVAAAALGALGQAAHADYSDGVAAFHNVSLEAGLRYWRKAAWQTDDFLSEMRLADIYDNSADSHYYDPVEAYVWYYLASHSARVREDDGNASQFLRDSRRRARTKQGDILVNLDAGQRADAHDRIIYILSCRGSDGFNELGKIHDTQNDSDNSEGGRGDKRTRADREEEMVGLTTNSVMVPNDAEALVYYHLAEAKGDPLARIYLANLEGRLRYYELGRHIVDDQAKKFHTWSPPYEFYPPGDSDSGIPYTDECPVSFERERALASAATALPPQEIRRALFFLGWGKGDARGIQRFQLTIGDGASGKLSAPEAVRLVQIASVRGDAQSQNTLGVMYAKGIGVVRNFVRAQFWFQKAADQRYGAALYHLGVLYKVGPEGIRQDLSRANDCFTASALAGFRPALNQLGDLLARAADEPAHPGQH